MIRCTDSDLLKLRFLSLEAAEMCLYWNGHAYAIDENMSL